MVNPTAIDAMSSAMADVYASVTDRILINLAHHFQYIQDGRAPTGSFEYQARMLAEMGQVTKESSDIIQAMLGGADEALKTVLENAIVESLKDEEPKLQQAAKLGLIGKGSIPELTPNQMQAFKSYYNQSADKLNLVNTVMLESTQAAYTGVISDIVNRINNTQSILNASAGEVITGVSTWNKAMHDAVHRMVSNGLTGFIDHAGRRWSPEAYVAMDIRTTLFNTGRAAIWERQEQYGNDLYQVSSHAGARPLCYPWQGKVISRTDMARDVEDLDGNTVHVYAQSETTYGQAAGLFGINCKHYPMTFIPGFSTLKGEPQSEKVNEKTYEESQQQRALERKLRFEKRELSVLKAQGADQEAIKAQRNRVFEASADIDAFCDATGRARRRNRDYTPINAKFPAKTSYDPKLFPTEERNKMWEFFKGNTTTAVVPQQMAQVTSSATNIFGEQIKFSEKLNSAKWDEPKKIINNLATEFKSKLKEVMPGAHRGAGEVQISGTIMHLSSNNPSTAIHEFAHTISIANQTKFGLYDEGDFWKEIRSIRTAYRKSVGDDVKKRISTYGHSSKEIDEFMAEAFTLGYMREKGFEIPSEYGDDIQFSARVLDAVKRYFGK